MGAHSKLGKGKHCLEGEAGAPQETGLGEGNFEENRGEMMILEKNKQRNTYPAEHMPRALEQKTGHLF